MPIRVVLLTLCLALVPTPARALTLQPAQSLPQSFPDPAPQIDGSGTAYLVALDGMLATAPFGSPLSTPAPVVPAAARPWEARAGVSAAGELVVVYTRRAARARVHRRTQVVYRRSDGSVSSPVSISQLGRTADAPQLAVNPAGAAIAAFVRHDADARWHVQYAVRPAGGRFGPPRTVAGDAGIIRRGGSIDVAVAPDGSGLLTWVTRPPDARTPGRLLALHVDRDGGYDTPVVLEQRAAPDSYGIPHGTTAASYGADGRGAVTWVRNPGDGGDRLMVAALSRDGVGEPATLFTTAGPLLSWDVVADGACGATAVWASYPSFGADVPSEGVTAAVRTSSRRAGGAWSTARTLSHPGVHVSPGGFARLGLVAVGTPAGEVVAAWAEQSRYSGTDERVWVAERSAAGTWSPAVGAGGSGARTMLPRAAMNEAGQLVMTWMAAPSPTTEPGSQFVFGAP